MKKKNNFVVWLTVLMMSFSAAGMSGTAFAAPQHEGGAHAGEMEPGAGGAEKHEENRPDAGKEPEKRDNRVPGGFGPEGFSMKAGVLEEANGKYKSIPVSMFRVSNLSPGTDTQKDYADWFYSGNDNSRYLFLPATADRSKLTVTFETENDATLLLDDTELVSGEETSLFATKDSFEITVGGKSYGTLNVMQSELGCIFLSTASGTIDKLDSNDDMTETGSVLMLSSNGEVQYDGDIDKLTAHGNSSWNNSYKKPYNLKLPEKADLYGMGKAKKWVLLSNYLDHSLLRNKITDEIARAAGMNTMDSVFVDLYADGSYRGTYVLSEKIQVQKNRINIEDLEEATEKVNDQPLSSYSRAVSGAKNVDTYMENSYKYYEIPNDPEDITGGYILEFQLYNRYGTDKTKCGFVTPKGQAVKLRSPEYASKAQTEYIRDLIYDVEEAIYSSDGKNSKGKHYSEYIDMDSLAKVYIIQEFTMNIDACQASFFFYKDSDYRGDGKLHCEPIWDFDYAYNDRSKNIKNSDGKSGSTSDLNSLFAAYFPIHGYSSSKYSTSSSGRPTYGVNWVGQLYKYKKFRTLVANTYFSDFEPFLKKLYSSEDALIYQYKNEIKSSAAMNAARWHMYGKAPGFYNGIVTGKNFDECVDYVLDFSETRQKALSSLWKDNTGDVGSSYVETVSMYGDINSDGVVNVLDASVLCKYLLKDDNNAKISFKNADINNDGILNIVDYCELLAMMV